MCHLVDSLALITRLAIRSIRCIQLCSTQSGVNGEWRVTPAAARVAGARRGAARRVLPGSALRHADCCRSRCEAPRAVTALHSRSWGWAPRPGWLRGPGAPSAVPPAPAHPRRAAAVTGVPGLSRRDRGAGMHAQWGEEGGGHCDRTPVRLDIEKYTGEACFGPYMRCKVKSSRGG